MATGFLVAGAVVLVVVAGVRLAGLLRLAGPGLPLVLATGVEASSAIERSLAMRCVMALGVTSVRGVSGVRFGFERL